jgi:hypothetical protein
MDGIGSAKGMMFRKFSGMEHTGVMGIEHHVRSLVLLKLGKDSSEVGGTQSPVLLGSSESCTGFRIGQQGGGDGVHGRCCFGYGIGMSLFNIQFNQGAGIAVYDHRRSSIIRSVNVGPGVSGGLFEKPLGFRPFQ